jgi:hypothetical protein
MKLLTIFICLAIANFAYQALTKHNFSVAFERSWFQGPALLVVYLTGRFL